MVVDELDVELEELELDVLVEVEVDEDVLEEVVEVANCVKSLFQTAVVPDVDC